MKQYKLSLTGNSSMANGNDSGHQSLTEEVISEVPKDTAKDVQAAASMQLPGLKYPGKRHLRLNVPAM